MVRRADRTRRASLLLALVVGALLVALGAATPASAHGTWWRLSSGAAPTNLPPGGEGQIDASASNLGFEDLKASPEHPVTIVDTVPAGLEVIPGTIRGYAGPRGEVAAKLACEQAAQVVTCKLLKNVPPYEGLEVIIPVKVAPGVPAGARLPNQVAISGGEDAAGPLASVTEQHILKVEAGGTPFGVEEYELKPETEEGQLEARAGAHPFQLTTTLNLNDTLELQGTPPKEEEAATAPLRDLHFVLPPGLLGNVTVVPQCTALQFSTIEIGDVNLCSPETAIGVARIKLNEPQAFHGAVTETVPIFNLVPGAGEPARFGIEVDKVPVILNTAVRTGSDYAVEVSVLNSTQVASVLDTQVTFWGVPGDARHDSARGWECIGDGVKENVFEPPRPCKPLGEASPRPFLTLPTSCSGIPKTTVTGNTWPYGPARTVSEFKAGGENTEFEFPSSLSDCEALDFNPSIGIEPDTHSASTPTGLTVKVDVPQASTLAVNGRAEADVKDTEVVLPEGVQASPAAANGLLACSGAQFGFNKGIAPVPGLGESAQTENTHFSADAVTCPEAAKIGTVNIKTPLLKDELTGSVYLASQDTDPFGSPLVLYLFAEDPVSGVRVKLAGEVKINQSTGQLTSVFSNTPPVPFEELTLSLFGGSTASQSTPALCGNYVSAAGFTPYNGAAVAHREPSFAITSGPGGSGCSPNPQSFGPSFQAGSVNAQAGGFTPFTLTIKSPDGDQPMNGLAMALPPGVAAMLSSVTPCQEPPAGQEWNCGSDSLIGHATTSSGLGGTPVSLTGQVYLTTGYDGGPFGLLVSTLAKTGPFNLGVVNVRSRINVDRSTAAVSITTDPGPRGEAFPTRLKGVPVALKQINVTVDRPNFQFNPTNCSPTQVSGTLSGSQGGSKQVSSPFQVTNCAALPFKPTLTATTKGNSTKANGASLVVKVTSTPGQANIAKTALILPIALPSRLSTIQKACIDKVFDANPATCPEGSNIGTATVHTPVLKNPLNGPAYLVSHGGAAFPDVEFVLQGEGITLILDGQTNIKKGITSSTFNAVPDAPVTTFETTLPEGPHSALTANVAADKKFSLCGTTLVMPTTITGQNGAVIKQETKIPVIGCKGVLPFKETRLQKALKSCRKQFKHKAKKRVACEKKARKKYGPKKAKKKSSKKKKK